MLCQASSVSWQGERGWAPIRNASDGTEETRLPLLNLYTTGDQPVRFVALILTSGKEGRMAVSQVKSM